MRPILAKLTFLKLEYLGFSTTPRLFLLIERCGGRPKNYVEQSYEHQNKSLTINQDYAQGKKSNTILQWFNKSATAVR